MKGGKMEGKIQDEGMYKMEENRSIEGREDGWLERWFKGTNERIREGFR